MKITHRLILGSLIAAIFGVECCINAKILVAVGDGDGNSALGAILVAPEKHSYLRSASRPSASASADLLLDKLSQIEPVNVASDNFIQSQAITWKRA
jgi:hypothetical protein